MKLISKLHIVNWHYIKYKTLEMNSGINFFTGKTGAGKSTIIDALQLIILGDVKGKYFNKAANDESKRTLIEYLKGMIKDDENEGKKFRRTKDFSSYIVMEIHDTKKNKKFCLGVIFDVRKDSNEAEHQFFFLDEPLPVNGFIKNNRILSIKELKDEFGHRYTPYSTEEYKEKFLHYHMGKLRKEYFDTFKKSVSFKPPKNIREFINDFVCEEVNIDIEEMKERIRAYRHLEKEMQITKEQIGYLQDIQKHFNNWNRLENEKNICEFIIDRCKVENISYEIIRLIKSIDDAKDFIKIHNEKLERLKEEIALLEESKKEIEHNIEHSEETTIRKKLEELKEKIDDLRERERYYKGKAVEFSKWADCLKDWVEIFNTSFGDEHELIMEINKMREYLLNELDFAKLNSILKERLVAVQKEYFYNANHWSLLDEEITQLKNENQLLNKGIKKYPDIVECIKNKVMQELYTLYEQEIKVEILADLIDVKDKSWKNAIEGYMNTQKMYLIVEPQYYEDAIKIYNNLDKEKYYGVGIVDIEKISKLKIDVKNNSLANEIVTDNRYARIYTNYLLGRVMKCEDISKIRNNDISITKECFLYKGFIARRLNPDSYRKNTYIGKDSITEKIKQNEESIRLKKESQLIIEQKNKMLQKYKDLKIYSDNDIVEIIENQKKIIMIPSINKEYISYQNKLANIDLMYVMELKKELQNNKDLISTKSNEKNNIILNIGKKQNLIEVTSELIPQKEEDKLAEEKELIENFGETWVEDIGEIRFKNELLKSNILSLRNKYEELLENEIEQQVEQAFKNLVEMRGKFLQKYILMWDKHDKSNNKFDSFLKDLVESELPSYESKIINQKQRAYAEFKEDLLYKLRDGIIKTEEQLKFLTKAIQDIRFGSKKYEFTVRGSKKYYPYYQMLKDDLLIMPNSLLSTSFEEKYQQQLDELFSLIADSGEKDLSFSEMEQIKKNIKKYTDYRTFLDFDMIEESNGISSDLSKTMLKTSGGETQSPFYIAVLASFIQLYRMNKGDNETMRLIVFDEAFSKMDEDHMEISVKLMKDLGFQSIIAAPDDKIRVIGPVSDKIFIVENNNKENISICEFEKESKERLLS